MPSLIDAPAQRFLPWYGANTANAEHAGELLDGCPFVVIMFAGGMCEIPYIRARQLIVNDKHREAIALAQCVASPGMRRALLQTLRWTAAHPDTLAAAQAYLRHVYAGEPTGRDETDDDRRLNRAYAYFVSQWLNRSGKSGTKSELAGKMPTRRNANGGGTAQRFWSAVRSLAEWGRVLQRCDFQALDWPELLDEFGQDVPGNGIYADPPWPGVGEQYLHTFTPAEHARLADRLSAYEHARVVVRYGDTPEISELYDRPGWQQHVITGRNQANGATRELYIVRNGGPRA